MSSMGTAGTSPIEKGSRTGTEREPNGYVGNQASSIHDGAGAIEPIRLHGNAYAPETVDTALLMLALTGGNCARAVAQMRGGGVDDPPTAATLRNWMHAYPNRYRALADKHARRIEESAVTRVRGVMLAGWDATADAIELARARIAEGDVKDAAMAAKSLASASAIATDRLMLLTDRPTQRTDDRSMAQILASLKRYQKGGPSLAPDFTLDVQARELPAGGSSAPSSNASE